MGLYIEVKDKRQWLINNSVGVVPDMIDWDLTRANHQYPVCLIDNGLFYAAGVAFSENELNRFRHNNVDDDRPKEWFIVGQEILYTVVDKKTLELYVKEVS